MTEGGPALRWRRSAHSGSTGGQCVEVAAAGDGTVGIRDSKDPGGPPEPGELERLIALRMERQQVLHQSADPLRLWAVMDEAVLRRPVGGPAVMRAQFQHLIEVAELPRVTLQVVPFASGGHAGESGSFTVLRFEERDLPDVVYIEQLTGAIYLDQRSDVEHYLGVVNEISVAALTPDKTARFIQQVAQQT